MAAQLKTCRCFDPEQLNLHSAEPLGSGAISQVVRTTLSCPPHTPVAVKITSKVQLLHQKKTQAAMNEKRALVELGPHPFIVRLYGTSQSVDELYYVMEYLPNGDLLQHIRTCTARHSMGAVEKEASLASSFGNSAPPKPSFRCLDFHDIQLITAQLVLGLSHVFENGFVLRDFKPENVAFDSQYRACILDFDTVDMDARELLPLSNNDDALGCKSNMNKSSSADSTKKRLTVSEIQAMRRMTASFCGTAQYVSPEMVGQCRWSYSSDLWALGTIVYEMMYGTHMFPGENTYEVMKRIVTGVRGDNVPFPQVDIGPEPDAFMRTKDLILQLCRTDPTKRLGVDAVTSRFAPAALRSHPFFGDFDWGFLEAHFAVFRASPVIDAPALSLRPRYHALPTHDPEYAKYVYEATADANPFERWAQEAPGRPCGEGSPAADGLITGAVSQPRPMSTESVCEMHDEDEDNQNDDDDDGSDEIIDDVGMAFVGRAHPDFAL